MGLKIGREAAEGFGGARSAFGRPGRPFLLYRYYGLVIALGGFRLVGRTSEISRLLISRVLFTARLFTQPDIALTTYLPLSPFSLLLR